MTASIPSWAVRGAKCVCVDAQPRAWTEYSDTAPAWLPVEGQVYTVALVYHRRDVAGLILVEQSDPNVFFAFARFRPLTTRTQEQDLSIFLPLLKTKEAADA